MLLEGILTAVVAYFIGAINPASVIARVRGVDLRSIGSGNPGATNASRALGRRTGVLVAGIDVLKGFLPAVVAGLVFGDSFGLLAGFAAFIGHITSPFLRFRGGKGVATAAGAVLGSRPLWALPVLVIFWTTFAITRRMGIASAVAALALIATGWILGTDWQDYLYATAMGVVILIRHQSNIRAAVTSVREGNGIRPRSANTVPPEADG